MNTSMTKAIAIIVAAIEVEGEEPAAPAVDSTSK
jgi:hypothetical protein